MVGVAPIPVDDKLRQNYEQHPSQYMQDHRKRTVFMFRCIHLYFRLESIFCRKSKLSEKTKTEHWWHWFDWFWLIFLSVIIRFVRVISVLFSFIFYWIRHFADIFDYLRMGLKPLTHVYPPNPFTKVNGNLNTNSIS